MPNHALILPLAIAALWAIGIATVIGLTRFAMVGTGKWTYKEHIKPGEPHGPRWYASLNRVLINSLESFALFAPAAVLHIVLNTQNGLLITLSWVYVAARVVYSLWYAATGYNIVCSIIWLVAFAPTLLLWVFLLM